MIPKLRAGKTMLPAYYKVTKLKVTCKRYLSSPPKRDDNCPRHNAKDDRVQKLARPAFVPTMTQTC